MRRSKSWVQARPVLERRGCRRARWACMEMNAKPFSTRFRSFSPSPRAVGVGQRCQGRLFHSWKKSSPPWSCGEEARVQVNFHRGACPLHRSQEASGLSLRDPSVHMGLGGRASCQVCEMPNSPSPEKMMAPVPLTSS